MYPHGGTAARKIGGAILAFFGAPGTHQDGPEQAIHGALARVHITAAMCVECERDDARRAATGHSSAADAP